jgi:hypothetical protein
MSNPASTEALGPDQQSLTDRVRDRGFQRRGLLTQEHLSLAGKFFLPLCYNFTSTRTRCLPMDARPGEYTPNREAFVFISTHGVIPGNLQSGIPSKVFDRKDFSSAFQVEKLTELLSVKKLTVSPPGVGLFTYDPTPEAGRAELAASRSITCGGYQSCLNQHLTATHDTFIAHVLEDLETKRAAGEAINLENIQKKLRELFFELKKESIDKGIKANIDEMNTIFNELSLPGARDDKDIMSVFLAAEIPSFIERLVELGKYTKPPDVTPEIQAKYDRLEELHEETADYKETSGAADRFFKLYTIKSGEKFINKLFGSTEEEASQPGLVYKITILNVPSDPNDPSSRPLPPVRINWFQEELTSPSSLANYISTKQLYTYLAHLGYQRAVIVDATCSLFDASSMFEMTPAARRLLRKNFYDLGIPYGGKKHFRKYTRKNKRKHTRKNKRKHSRKNKRKHTRKYY